MTIEQLLAALRTQLTDALARLTASRDAEHDAPIWHDRGRTVTALAHTAGVRVEYVHVDMSRQTVERREVTQ